MYLNNFYNSYELQLELYSRDTYTVGILQKNCKGNSKAIVNVNLKKGEAVYRRNGVPEMLWEKMSVIMMSTVHLAVYVEVKKRHSDGRGG